ncbi:DUF6519 domain-containing protein [Rhizobacter sp. OV335]|uniref:DUF6519 domain-containing protein n=1 Tax=Rhizobacter sp. OV335 TaxID=1500264 RepID=UPI000916C359|nr:DUF6519 domain-containing protein [Rhizobacter sp. OV335]SHN08814.1 Right handed beta helix region [Rhizobacter sp. OV335]
MKGDFSFLPTDPPPHYSGVLHQQGRVLLDRDWNEAAAIAATWRSAVGRDTFGAGVLAVPVSGTAAFKVLDASTDGAVVKVRLDAGRAWADGLSLTLDKPASFLASYFAPPFQSPTATAKTIADGVRDLVVLEAWEDTLSGFQDPLHLIEPALGGPDTTERTQAYISLKLLRLGPNEDCSAAAGLADDLGSRGRLTVSPAPVLNITGDCPLEAGGGYTGLEHYLYRIEIADPDSTGRARFKWSQWNGGLVGRGLFTAGAPGTATLAITANDQMINHCGLQDFYLEALAPDAARGGWSVRLSADATLSQDGVLALSNVQGVWPAVAPSSGFFRLWNGIELVQDFPPGGANPVELKDGIRVELDAASAGNANYLPGDYWTFPVRAAGAVFEPAPWPVKAPPQGILHHRVALGILNWSGPPPVDISFANGEIDDCRRIFRPLTNQKICCTFNVGDGRSSRGDFDSIEEALQHLPASGGEICLLPGLHTTNAVIDGRSNVRIKGCDTKTKVIPRKEGAAQPIFTVRDSHNVVLEHMDLVTLGGTAIVVGASQRGACSEIEIAHNRILACTNAIRARQVRGIHIHDNRIRMLDKRGSDVAIYLAGDDGLIERNDIRLVPAPAMPPLDVPTEPDPLDPNDPCAKLEIVYFNPRLFVTYVNAVWTLLLPPLILLLQPYRALGGIQLGGGSERVTVLENAVTGGAGNGVTLGGTPPAAPPQEEAPVFTLPRESIVRGLVIGPDGKPMAGVQVTLTNLGDGTVITPQPSDAKGEFTFGSVAAKFSVGEGEAALSIDKLDVQDDPNQRFFQLTVVLKADQTPLPEDSGFLYDIAIERNAIEAMGLSGIGIATAAVQQPARLLSVLAAAAESLGTPVVGLAIRGNRIRGCLLNPFDNVLRARAAKQGLGGISLGLVQNLAIVDNVIERNGPSGADPVCGIFVNKAIEAEVTHNRIVDNGPLTSDATSRELVAGLRGGIFFKWVTNFEVLGPAEGEGRLTFSRRPAARIHENVVDQPVGQALFMLAFGPVLCTDNAFSSDLSGLGVYERLAGTVYLYDLGGVTESPAGMKLLRSSNVIDTSGVALDRAAAAAPAAAPAGASRAAAFGSFHAAPVLLVPQRDAAVADLIPPGNVLFHSNELRTGARNTSAVCHWVTAEDDLSWQQNQSFCLHTNHLLANAMLTGNAALVIGNRLSERGQETQASLMTLGIRLNNTSFNQGDHCIIANTSSPAVAEVQYGNQVLNPGPQCQSRSLVTALLFKPQG